jgi:hypothetical protein
MPDFHERATNIDGDRDGVKTIGPIHPPVPSEVKLTDPSHPFKFLRRNGTLGRKRRLSLRTSWKSSRFHLNKDDTFTRPGDYVDFSYLATLLIAKIRLEDTVPLGPEVPRSRLLPSLADSIWLFHIKA